MKLLIIFISFIQVSPLWTPGEITYGNHAIYLSMVEISHQKNETSTDIRIKVFLDDMEDAIRNSFGDAVSLTDASACDKYKANIQTYFNNHFIFSINNTKAVIRLESCEIAGDAISFRFETNGTAPWKEVSLTADFLMELFPTQANIVTIQYGEEKKFLKLTKSKVSELVKF